MVLNGIIYQITKKCQGLFIFFTLYMYMFSKFFLTKNEYWSYEIKKKMYKTKDWFCLRTQHLLPENLINCPSTTRAQNFHGQPNPKSKIISLLIYNNLVFSLLLIYNNFISIFFPLSFHSSFLLRHRNNYLQIYQTNSPFLYTLHCE